MCVRERERHANRHCPLAATSADAIIFAGAGASAAIQKMADILGLGLLQEASRGRYLCTFPGCLRCFQELGTLQASELPLDAQGASPPSRCTISPRSSTHGHTGTAIGQR